jgi:hypothetical protein
VQKGWYDRKLRRVRDLSCGDTRIFLELEVRRLDCRFRPTQPEAAFTSNGQQTAPISMDSSGEFMTTRDQTVPSLVLADESAADGGRFVTGGLLRLPADSVETALARLTKVKTDRGESADAKIHCRSGR